MQKTIQAKILPSSGIEFVANFYEIVDFHGSKIINFYFHDGSPDPALCITLLLDDMAIYSIREAWDQFIAQTNKEKDKSDVRWENVKKRAERVAPISRCNIIYFRKIGSFVILDIAALSPEHIADNTSEVVNIKASISISISFEKCQSFVSELLENHGELQSVPNTKKK